MEKILDLGCGKQKLKGAFGVDFIKLQGVDFVWDLNKALPKKFHKQFDTVYSSGLLEHLGNPLDFLQNCALYLKKKGKLVIITDNGDYWRFHFEHEKFYKFFGAYHATLWQREEKNPMVQHKMFFQKGHLTNLLALTPFKIKKSEYFYQKNLDRIFPKKFGSMYLRLEAEKK